MNKAVDMANSDRRIAASERQRRALELRLAGISYDGIARQLQYASRSGAYKAVDTALRATLREPADSLRKISAERLDRATTVVWRAIGAGDLKAVDVLVRLEARRARLFGLDVPERRELSGPDGAALQVDLSGLSDRELAELERLRRKIDDAAQS